LFATDTADRLAISDVKQTETDARRAARVAEADCIAAVRHTEMDRSARVKFETVADSALIWVVKSQTERNRAVRMDRLLETMLIAACRSFCTAVRRTDRVCDRLRIS
jgi:hypothetical protein